MTEKQIADRLEDIFRLYQIDKKWFKKGFNDETITNTPFEFTNKSFEIMKVLIKSINDYPLVKSDAKIQNEKAKETKKNKLDVESLQKYYQALVDAIDSEIADQATRVQIKQSSNFEKTITEIEGARYLSDKMSHFLAASNTIPEIARMELWARLYREIDGLIYECFDRKVALKEEYKKEYDMIFDLYKLQLESIKHPMAPSFVSASEEFTKELTKQRKKDLENLVEKYKEINKFRSLDQFLVHLMLEEAYKYHFRTQVQSLQKQGMKIKKDSYGYDLEVIQQLVEKEEQENENRFVNQHKELIQKVTGYTIEELNQLKVEQNELKTTSKKKELQQFFEQIETTDDRTKKLLTESQEKSNDYPLEHLNRRSIGVQLKSIYNQLTSIHEDVSGVLYESLTSHEKNDYLRVLEVVEQSTAGIDMLQQPSRVREGMQQAFYEDYLKFYERTKETVNQFNSKAQAFTISTSIEALEKKLHTDTTNEKE